MAKFDKHVGHRDILLDIVINYWKMYANICSKCLLLWLPTGVWASTIISNTQAMWLELFVFAHHPCSCWSLRRTHNSISHGDTPSHRPQTFVNNKNLSLKNKEKKANQPKGTTEPAVAHRDVVKQWNEGSSSLAELQFHIKPQKPQSYRHTNQCVFWNILCVSNDGGTSGTTFLLESEDIHSFFLLRHKCLKFLMLQNFF